MENWYFFVNRPNLLGHSIYVLHSELETSKSLKSTISQIFNKQIKNFHKMTFVQDEKLELFCKKTKLVGTLYLCFTLGARNESKSKIYNISNF